MLYLYFFFKKEHSLAEEEIIILTFKTSIELLIDIKTNHIEFVDYDIESNSSFRQHQSLEQIQMEIQKNQNNYYIIMNRILKLSKDYNHYLKKDLFILKEHIKNIKTIIEEKYTRKKKNIKNSLYKDFIPFL